MIGRVIDERYRVLRQLGEGGIGRVYVAQHLRLGREVAIKTLLTRYESIPVLKERFTREAAALASLNHPNIVTVTDFGVDDGTPYLVMELLAGEDLAALIERGEPLAPQRVMRIVRQMVRALAYAHEQKLVHRDLKPHNVFVRALGPYDDHVEVLDFGLARFLSDAWKSAPKLTAQGALIGTPAYMAPEQASGQDVDATADIYASGCVLFEALTGRRVFEGKTQADIMRAHMLTDAPTLREADPGLAPSPALDALVARCLEKSPSRRYPNGRALLEALDALGWDPVQRVGPRPRHEGVAPSAIAPTQTSTRPSGPLPAQPHASAGAPANSAPIELPTRRLPWILGASVAAVLLVGLGAGGVYVALRVVAPPHPHAVPLPAPVQLPVPDLPSVPPPVERPPAREPFAVAAEVPEALRPVLAELDAGRGTWRAQISTISRYQSAHRDDPLPALLLGRIYTQEGLFDPALTQYDAAYTLDASVRGDPSMRRDLIRIARDEAQHGKAGALIRDAWGREAVGEIDAQLRSAAMGADERARLTELREYLATR